MSRILGSERRRGHARLPRTHTQLLFTMSGLLYVCYMYVICMSPFDVSLFFVSAEQEIEFDHHR